MPEVNFYDGKIHTEWGGKQPVKNGTPVRGWTRRGDGDWEGAVWPAEQWCWKILNDYDDLVQFQVVIDNV